MTIAKNKKKNAGMTEEEMKSIADSAPTENFSTFMSVSLDTKTGTI
jgi:hypothetical protein